jgi:hypothetical protein
MRGLNNEKIFFFFLGEIETTPKKKIIFLFLVIIQMLMCVHYEILDGNFLQLILEKVVLNNTCSKIYY